MAYIFGQLTSQITEQAFTPGLIISPESLGLVILAILVLILALLFLARGKNNNL